MLSEEGLLLRVFIGESDKHEGVPLYEWLIQKAKSAGLAGATVFRGIEGFGAHSKIRSTKFLDMSAALPVVVEVVDQAERIEQFLSVLDEVVFEGAATVSKVHLRVYRSNKS
jgi:PII-like signaling protein